MGSETNRSSPVPWMGLLLAGVFALATLQAERAAGPHVRVAHDQLSEASRYFDEHPYLEVGPALSARMTYPQIRNRRETYERAREQRGEPRVIAGVMRRQQQTLDAMVDEAAAALDALPARSFGVDPGAWRPATLVTYVALHSGAVHLAGCVLLLLLFAVYLEPVIGPVRFLAVSLCATLGAGMGWAFSLPDVRHVLIGSSGMLAGLWLVFAWELRESRKEGFYALGVVGGALWLALPTWLGTPWSISHPGVELLGPSPSPQLLYYALVGGIAGGLSGNLVFRLLGGRRGEAGLSHEARTSTGSVSLDQALAERTAGREESAYQKLTVLLHKEPENLDAALLLADVARTLGKHDAADAAMLRAIRLEAKRDQAAAAIQHWFQIAQREVPRDADPALLIRIATLLRHQDHPRSAAAALRAALDRATGSNTAPVATRVARAAQELDPTIAHDAAWKALGCAEISLEERQNLEDLLAVVMHRLPGAEVMISNAWSEDARKPAKIDIEDGAARTIELVQATPLALGEDALEIQTGDGGKRRLPYDRIDAVAVGAVQGLSDKPVLIVDLVLNWKASRDPRLRVVRLRGDRFDPRRLVSAATPVEAFRSFVSHLLERAWATPLPDRDSALGNPFASYEQLSLYERTVLMAESKASGSDA